VRTNLAAEAMTEWRVTDILFASRWRHVGENARRRMYDLASECIDHTVLARSIGPSAGPRSRNSNHPPYSKFPHRTNSDSCSNRSSRHPSNCTQEQSLKSVKTKWIPGDRNLPIDVRIDDMSLSINASDVKFAGGLPSRFSVNTNRRPSPSMEAAPPIPQGHRQLRTDAWW
jgi:hypothetical protein